MAHITVQTNQTCGNTTMNNAHNSPTKPALCRYLPVLGFESDAGGLRLMLPTHDGYIFYHIMHTVMEQRNADTWRLGQAFAADDALENAYEITPSGAEWDMALRLRGRDDFIGGYAHGDEKFTALSMQLDGRPVEITSLTDPIVFKEIRIRVSSVGYDPNDHITAACKHEKEYVIDRDGVTLHQTVEWLNDYRLTSCYMAMMPPKKTLTDSYATDVDPTSARISDQSFSVPHCTQATVFGTTLSKLHFEMNIPQYPSFPESRFLVTDNGNGRYNKMYFVICKDSTVTQGDVWTSTTCYRITNGREI